MLLQKFLAGSLVLLVGHPLVAAPPTSAKPAVQRPFQSIKIFPADILLGSRRSSQRIVVQGFYADGYSEDITIKARIAVGDSNIAQVSS
ncbi:MAG TPA: hypothetical protein VFS12_13235, partial [Terriglobia bacterium]|nr:hypothetical protein [Terriglobia bacterium]